MHFTAQQAAEAIGTDQPDYTSKQLTQIAQAFVIYKQNGSFKSFFDQLEDLWIDFDLLLYIEDNVRYFDDLAEFLEHIEN